MWYRSDVGYPVQYLVASSGFMVTSGTFPFASRASCGSETCPRDTTDMTGPSEKLKVMFLYSPL